MNGFTVGESGRDGRRRDGGFVAMGKFQGTTHMSAVWQRNAEESLTTHECSVEDIT